MASEGDKSCVEFFIDQVKDRPLIYNLKDKRHMDNNLVKLAWKEIMAELKKEFEEHDLVRAKLSTIEDLKKKYHGLRLVH